MVLSNFRKKKIFASVFCLTTCLIISFTLIHKKNADVALPFDAKELTFSDPYKFFYLKDAFKQPVPDITHLKYHQNSAKSCTYKSPTLLIVVHSAPTHVLHRKAIRKTWGLSTKQMQIRTVFVVGRSLQIRVWQRVKREAAENRDIVLVDMPDTYNNLTMKHLVGISWALKNCPKVSYVLKADDDAFVNMHHLEKVVLANLPLHTIACRIVPSGTAPRRSGKWKVTRLEYPFDDYPEYCSGLAYFSRPSTLKSMYEAATSGRVPYLWIDDVFMTGFSAAYAKIKRMDLSVWFARTEEQVILWLGNSTARFSFPWMVAEMMPQHWPSKANVIWNKSRFENDI